MAKLRKKPYKKTQGRFAMILSKIFESVAYKELTPRQRDLYTHCKNEEFHPKRYKPDKNDLTQFYFNELVWSDKIDPTTGRQGYGLYGTNNAMHFYRDMDALIMHGFIKCIYCGANAKQRNIYQYSDKWQKYGTAEFEILPEEMTKSLLNKRKKQAASKKTQNDTQSETQIPTPPKSKNHIKKPASLNDETAERKNLFKKQLEDLK